MGVRFSLIGMCALLAACGNDPTSVLLQIGGAPATVTRLDATIWQDGSPAGTPQPVAGGAPVTLPGSAIVKLADVSVLLHVQLEAALDTGEVAWASGQVQTRAHGQVTLGLSFGDAMQSDAGAMDGGGNTDGGDGGGGDLSSTDLGQHVIAQDTFFRPNQTGFGTASDSQVWGDEANTAVPPFSIASHTGFMSMGTAGVTYSATLGPSTADADVLVLGEMDTIDGTCTWGPVARFTDAGNNYRAYVDGTNLVLERQLGGVSSVLGMVTHPLIPGSYFNIRLQVLGSTIRARKWANGISEPATWDVMATDNALTSGKTGIRAMIPTQQIHFKSFQAMGN